MVNRRNFLVGALAVAGALALGRSSLAQNPIAIGVATPGLPWDLTSLNHHEAVIAKRNAIVNFFWSWDDANYTPDMSLFANIAARGSVPMITWMPQDYRLRNQSAYSLSAILRGRHDAFLAGWARSMATYDGPVLMRFAHEMNGNWYSWSGRGNTASEYVQVWRKLVTMFRAAGATNVKWVWCPNVENRDPAPWFPGDAYVDYVALDGYNSTTFGWRSFDAIFRSSYNRICQISTKPVMIAEVGTSEGVGDAKAVWLRDMFATVATMPRVIAVVYFDVNMTAQEGPGRDWRIESSASALEAYRAAVAPLSSTLMVV